MRQPYPQQVCLDTHDQSAHLASSPHPHSEKPGEACTTHFTGFAQIFHTELYTFWNIVQRAVSVYVFLFLPGLCIRPTEIALLVGSHGPTMNVYIAKMTVPDPCTAIVPIEPWPVHYSQT